MTNKEDKRVSSVEFEKAFPDNEARGIVCEILGQGMAVVNGENEEACLQIFFDSQGGRIDSVLFTPEEIISLIERARAARDGQALTMVRTIADIEKERLSGKDDTNQWTARARYRFHYRLDEVLLDLGGSNIKLTANFIRYDTTDWVIENGRSC